MFLKCEKSNKFFFFFCHEVSPHHIRVGRILTQIIEVVPDQNCYPRELNSGEKYVVSH